MRCRVNVRAVPACAAVIAPAVLITLAATCASAAPLATTPTSPQYAGWTITTARPGGQASTLFHVPTVTCTSTKDSAVVGVAIPTSSSIIASGVVLACSASKASYTAETDIDGTVTKLPVTVKPGDRIFTSLTAGATKTSGVFKDLTADYSKAITGGGGKGFLPTVGIDGSETSKTANPVPDFGKVAFFDTKIDETALSSSGATAVNMATSSGVLQIQTGAVNAKGGFTAKFVAAG